MIYKDVYLFEFDSFKFHWKRFRWKAFNALERHLFHFYLWSIAGTVKTSFIFRTDVAYLPHFHNVSVSIRLFQISTDVSFETCMCLSSNWKIFFCVHDVEFIIDAIGMNMLYLEQIYVTGRKVQKYLLKVNYLSTNKKISNPILNSSFWIDIFRLNFFRTRICFGFENQYWKWIF